MNESKKKAMSQKMLMKEHGTKLRSKESQKKILASWPKSNKPFTKEMAHALYSKDS